MTSDTATRLPTHEAGTAVDAEAYERIALADPDVRWELDGGRLREKPGMSVEHDSVMFYLGHLLQSQLDRREFRLRSNSVRLRGSTGKVYVPDVAVVPTSLELALRRHPGSLDAFAQPLPLVVEIWSPSTGTYDLTAKVEEYRRRGDAEIWRLHPYERTLIAWRRQPNGSYTETLLGGGAVRPVALPDVTIDLDTLFEG